MVDKKKRYEATLNEMKRPIIYDEISEKEYYNGYDIADLLNYKEGKITELEERNNRQCKLLKEIWDLIFDRNWELLDKKATEIEKQEKQLQKERVKEQSSEHEYRWLVW